VRYEHVLIRCQVYGRLKSMTNHVSDRDREQVVIDLENLKTISALRHKNMGLMPPELDTLLVSASHFVCRLMVSCTSYARAPPPAFMRAAHACVAVLNNIAARTAGVQMNSDSVLQNLVATGGMLTTAVYAARNSCDICFPSLLLQHECAFVNGSIVAGAQQRACLQTIHFFLRLCF
jgi:uncharacterized protein YuzB (UPF0349 family)